jgi:hypothetical protein
MSYSFSNTLLQREASFCLVQNIGDSDLIYLKYYIERVLIGLLNYLTTGN